MSKSPIVDLSSESEDELFEEDDIDLHRTISPSHEEVNREMASELLTEESRVCSGPNASIYSTASNSAYVWYYIKDFTSSTQDFLCCLFVFW